MKVAMQEDWSEPEPITKDNIEADSLVHCAICG